MKPETLLAIRSTLRVLPILILGYILQAVITLWLATK